MAFLHFVLNLDADESNEIYCMQLEAIWIIVNITGAHQKFDIDKIVI